MTRVLKRLISVLLLVIVAGGGGRLATVDALLFHEVVGSQDPLFSHFEASSECHDDGCSVRSVAHETRSTVGISTPAIIPALPESTTLVVRVPAVVPALPVFGLFSRAPPLSI